MTIGETVAAVRGLVPDLSHSSLRFLEREGLLRPTRTPGGHRLYSRADIDRIVQIKAWQDQRLSLANIRQRLARLDRLPSLPEVTESFLRQAIAGDRVFAWQTVIWCDDAGVPLSRLFDELLRPALVEVGARWERGELSVAQEKESSELARELITELAARHAQPDAGGPVLVAACVEGERHELGLRMVCGLLRAQGYRVHFLGADVAPRFLVDAIRLRQPDAVMLSVTLGANVYGVRDAMSAIAGASLPDTTVVAVGGEAARRHANEVRAWGALPFATGTLEGELAGVMGAIPPHDNATARVESV